MVSEVTGMIGVYYLHSEYLEYIEVKADGRVSIKELKKQQIRTVNIIL